MKRYHFSIGGEAYELGLVGALFVDSDHQALAMLDEILATCEGATVVDNFRGREPDAADVATAKISYVNVTTNGVRATMVMFDEIEGDDERDAARGDEPAADADDRESTSSEASTAAATAAALTMTAWETTTQRPSAEQLARDRAECEAYYAERPEHRELDKRGNPVSHALPQDWQTVIVDRGAAFWLAGTTLMWAPLHSDDTIDWEAGGEVDFLGVDESDAAINEQIRAYLLGVPE